MGLFSFFKKQLLSVIEWKDENKEVLASRFEHSNREEIMNSSTLVVRPSQMAVFVHKGQIADVFKPGTYKLSTENIPVITKLASLPTGFNSPIKAEVYFLNTKQIIGQKWGTSNPIMMRDKEFGSVRLRTFGVYSFKIENAKAFVEELLGTNSMYHASEVCEQIKPILVQAFSDAVSESGLSALDLASNYNELAELVKGQSKAKLSTLGIKLCSLVIENISLPEEVEKALDERTKLGVLEDKMGTFAQYQAAQAIRDAAQNEGGANLAGMGVGMGAGIGIGEMFAKGFKDAKNTEKGGMICAECGENLPKNAKFCPICGKKIEKQKFCPACGERVGARAKFCPSCGEKI